jgi:hypothetical protein
MKAIATGGHAEPHDPSAELRSELLILPDGRVLVHNLTPAFARVLEDLDAADERFAHPATCRTPGARLVHSPASAGLPEATDRGTIPS